MGFLKFWSLCLFDAIVELHATNEKVFDDFLIRSEDTFFMSKMPI